MASQYSQNATIVAEAIRVEFDPETNSVFLVFEIKDEDFKKRIRKDWTQDIPLKLIGKSLVPIEKEEK